MSNLPQIIEDLQRRVADLEVRLEESDRARLNERERNLYRYRKFRVAIIRLETGASGERWHVGGGYVRGSRLRIPIRPPVLDEGYIRPPNPHPLDDKELINGGRNGIPATV